MRGQFKSRIFALLRIFATLQKPDLRVSPLVFRASGDHLLVSEISTGFITHLGHDILDCDVVVDLLLTY